MISVNCAYSDESVSLFRAKVASSDRVKVGFHGQERVEPLQGKDLGASGMVEHEAGPDSLDDVVPWPWAADAPSAPGRPSGYPPAPLRIAAPFKHRKTPVTPTGVVIIVSGSEGYCRLACSLASFRAFTCSRASLTLLFALGIFLARVMKSPQTRML